MYQLTEEQRKNLLVFLQRLDLKGAEVPAFGSILDALNTPVEIGKQYDSQAFDGSKK